MTAARSGELPSVDIVDLREELRLGNRTIFSNRLRELMSDRLAKHEQIMLFLIREEWLALYHAVHAERL